MKSASYYLNTGIEFFKRGILAEALSNYHYALELEPKNPSIHYNLSIILRMTDSIKDSYYHQLKAIELGSEKSHYFAHMGLILQEMDDIESSVYYYEKAVELATENINVYFNLSLGLQKLKRFDEAYRYQLSAVGRYPDNPEFNNNMGIICMNTGKYLEASDYFLKAIGFNNNAKYYCNLGLAYKNIEKYDKSCDIYDKCINLFPEFAEAHLGFAEILLLLGDYENGLREYEWRFFIENSSIKIMDKWIYGKGKKDLKRPDISSFDRKKIYVYSEQALGDTIKYVRFLKLLKNEERNIIFECQPALKRLLEKVEGFDSIVEEGNFSVPEYNISIPLMSLPYIFDIKPETIPNEVPYIFADDEMIRKWEPKIPDKKGLKIGFVWKSGSNPLFSNRSCPVELFYKLSKLNDVFFFSLQKGGSTGEDLKNLPPDAKIVDLLSDNINDFADTAGIISNLDLVISVDTSIAQLAGAMGKPVWVLLPLIPYWPWMLKRNDCIWYPTMKVFRQEKNGDWDSVFKKIEGELLQYNG